MIVGIITGAAHKILYLSMKARHWETHGVEHGLSRAAARKVFITHELFITQQCVCFSAASNVSL